MNKNQELLDREMPLVSISCITYNHAPYIRQCLDGMLMQKTSFTFEILIHDDASTDDTDIIIKEYADKYPNIIKPIFEAENQYQSGKPIGTLVWNLPRAKGKYIALCEGDDYWIDENKLQMQVDFLEKNPEYGMCYTKTKQFLQEKKKFARKTFGSEERSFKELLQIGNNIPTLTVCIRKEILNKYIKEIQPENKGWLMGDYPMWLYISKYQKIKFFDKVTSCYRILANSASHSRRLDYKMRFLDSYWDIKNYFCKLYDVKISRRNINRELFDQCVNLLKVYGYNKDYVVVLKAKYQSLFSISKRDMINYYVCSNNIFLKCYRVLFNLE